MRTSDAPLEEVTYGNGGMKKNYKRKCVDLPSTVQRKRDGYGYQVIEIA